MTLSFCGTITNMKLKVEYWIIPSEIFYTFSSLFNMPLEEYPLQKWNLKLKTSFKFKKVLA